MLPTLDELVRAVRRERQQRRLWRIARDLSRRTLQADGGDDGTSLDDLVQRQEAPRFLGFYTEAGLDAALRAYGFGTVLQHRGFPRFRTQLVADDQDTSTLRCLAEAEGREHLVTETRCRLIPLPPFAWVPPGEVPERVLARRAARIEWMLLQDPRAAFTAERPRLPGQQHPGLGIGRSVMDVLTVLGWRLRLSAYVITPLHFHNAVLYARWFRFLVPEDQGRFLALVEAAGARPLQQIALAVDAGFLRDRRTDAPVRWEPRLQIAPLATSLRRAFASATYREAAARAYGVTSFRFDWEGYDRRHAELVAGLG